MKTTKRLLLLSFFSGCYFLFSQQADACSFKPSFSGNTTVCAGAATPYVTKSTSGHYYRWVVSGGSVVSGAGTDSIMVNWPSPGSGIVKLIDSTASCYDSLSVSVSVSVSSSSLMAAPFKAVGSSSISGKTNTLTTASGSETGAVWSTEQINLNRNFDFTFSTNQNGSADGMMFVIQNTGLSAYSSAGAGSDLGYYNAPTGTFTQSIGVEEDIYLSSSAYDDSSASHLNLVNDDSPTPLRPQVNISPGLGGGTTHKLRIKWQRDINLFQVYFDGTLEFSRAADIVKGTFGGKPKVWFGFTGATAGLDPLQTMVVDTLIYNHPDIMASNDTICSGDSVTLTASPGLGYYWSTGARTRSIKVTSSATYSVAVQDSSNCIDTVNYVLKVVTATRPKAAFTTASGCAGTVLVLTNTSTPTTGVNYVWKYGNGDSSKGQSGSETYRLPNTYKVSLKVSNGGCYDTVSHNVVAYAPPSGITISKKLPLYGAFNTGEPGDPDYICLGDTNQYQITSPRGLSNSDYGKKWTSSIVFKTVNGTIDHDTIYSRPTATKNGIFKFFPSSKFADSTLVLNIMVTTLPGNCDTLMFRYIQVRPYPTAKFGAASSCFGGSTNFIDSSKIASYDNITSWNWSFGDSTTSTSQDPKHPYAKPGTYKATLTVANNAGCGATVSKSVSVYPIPTAVFSNTTGCSGASTSFHDSSTIISGSITSQAWSFGDGAKSTSTALNPTHTYVKSGPYNVKLVTTSGFGCKDSVTQKIRIGYSPVPVISYRNACVGTDIYFGSNNSKDSASLKSTYTWDFGDKTTATAPSPGHIFSANGTYKVVLTIHSGNGCSDTASEKVTPFASPNVKLTFSPGCAGQSVPFVDSSGSGTLATYDWNYGDGKTVSNNSNTTSHLYAKAGKYNVTLSITNGSGCTDSETRVITVAGFPHASFSANSVCLGNPTTFVNSSTGADTAGHYGWDFGDSTAASTAKNPVHTYKTAGTYNVKLAAVNASGCAYIDSQAITVNPVPVIVPWQRKQNKYTVKFVPKDTTIGTFKWYFGTATNDSSSKRVPTFTYPTADAKYQVKLVVTNASGCKATLTDSVFTGKYNGIAEPLALQNNINVFPNPFENSTNIDYTLQAASHVIISVYDIQGKEVARLKDGNYPAGSYSDKFDARKYSITEGTYILKMYINDQYYTTRIVNMK